MAEVCTRCGSKAPEEEIACTQCRGFICDECMNHIECDKCDGRLCSTCTDWGWQSQLISSKGVTQYVGSVFQLDSRGVGHRYCQNCWNSIQPSK
jgi:hypothetical protein